MYKGLPECADVADEPKHSKKQAQEAPLLTQPAQPVAPSPAPDPSQPSGTDPSELAKKLEGVVYEDFDPLLLKQNEAAHRLEFDTYDAALDEFYAKVACLPLAHSTLIQSTQHGSKFTGGGKQSSKIVGALKFRCPCTLPLTCC